MNLTEVKAMLKGRRLADPALIHAAILRREADREQATDLEHLRDEIRKAKEQARGAAVAGSGRLDIDEDVRELHGRGLTDSEIASHLSVHRTTVGDVRRALSLEANEKAEPPEFVTQVAALVKQGRSDDQIARQLGCGRPRVSRVREAHGLAEVELRRKRSAPRIRALIQSGWGDEEIARAVGRPLRVVEQTRREMRAELEQKAVGQ